ncbi:MAG: ribosome-associated translation inhibitor RaiA [Sphingomicrobium sp.]
MEVRVAGHQVDTGTSLREYAIGRMEELTEKYFSRAIAANVTFGRGPHNDFTCDIVAPVAQGVVLKASNRGAEAQLAFNGAADRIETQLRRYVKRLREHKTDVEQPYVENAGYTVLAAPRDDAEAGTNPAIIAETRADIPEASVSDAVMLMDLRNTNALMFKNKASGAFNMIYRREDGNIGWVEPRDA